MSVLLARNPPEILENVDGVFLFSFVSSGCAISRAIRAADPKLYQMFVGVARLGLIIIDRLGKLTRSVFS